MTTADMVSNTRLWRLRFDDLRRPEDSGTIEILINNSGGRMFNNICVDGLGRVLILRSSAKAGSSSTIRSTGPRRHELVEDGQLVAMYVDPRIGAPADDDDGQDGDRASTTGHVTGTNL